MDLITKESQGMPGYVPNRVINTKETVYRNFKWIFIAKIANVLCEVAEILSYIENLHFNHYE